MISSGARVNGGITGSQSYSLVNGTFTKNGLNSGLTYIISYWSNSGPQQVNGGSPAVTGMSVQGWTYYEHTVSGVSSVITSGSGTIDELRLYPRGSLMVTSTYAPMIGVTALCNENNKLMYYLYDGLGRLRWIRDQEGNILRSYNYQYQEHQ